MTDVLDRLGAALADRYVIERELGAGGMATVYLAQDLRHDRKVAIKVLRPELAAVIGAERFLSEIKTTANLQHPHILPLFDSGAADSFLFYVMPYVEGESLRDRITREHQLPVADAVRLATEIAGALDYAHRHGVIHRDIKPENVMLHDGQALVADFGIALAMANTAGTRMTETGMSLGTPHYMSPEQAMGEREITGRSDVYALGAITYEMLCGEPPFTGPTAQAIIARVMTEEPRGLTIQRKSIPPAVEGAVRQALEKLPADRFATAAEFAAALKDPTATSYRTAATPIAGGGRLFGRGALVGLALGLAGVLLVQRLMAPEAAPRTTPVAFTLDSRDALAYDPASSVRPSLSISPDGRTLAYLGRRAGLNIIVVRELGSLEPRALPGTDGANDLTFSPDGREILFRQGTSLMRTSLEGAAPTRVASIGQAAAIYGLAWLPSDTAYYLLEAAHSLYKVSVAGNDEPVTVPISDSLGLLVELEPVPGGEWLLTNEMSGTGPTGELLAISIRDGSHRRLGVTGVAPLVIDGGRHLLIGKENGVLTIARFDSKRVEVGGAEVTALEGVQPSTVGLPSVGVGDDGTLAFVTGSESDRTIVEVDRQGVERVRIAEPAEYTDPRYSPDGNRIAYERVTGLRGDIWIHDARTGTNARLTNESENLYPTWTPDGTRLVFTSRRAGLAGLWWQPVDGSAPAEQLLTGSDDELWFAHAITRDGRTLVIRRNNAETGLDIGKMPLEPGGTPEVVLGSTDNESSPVLSPDNRWMAFVSSASGTNEVYVTPWPAVGPRTQISTGGGEEPQWNPQGGELFYRTGDALVAATLVERDGLLAPLKRDTLFTGNYVHQPRWSEYDVSPDGERFLMIKAGSARPEVVVMTDWVRQAIARLERGDRP